MSLLKDIKKVHGRFIEMGEEFFDATDTEGLEEKFAEFDSGLRTHFEAEEAVLFAEAEELESTKGRTLLEKMIAQHDLIIMQLDALQTVDLEDPAWFAKMDVLLDLLEYHFEVEEDDFFPRAKKRIGKDGLKELEVGYRELVEAASAPEDEDEDPEDEDDDEVETDESEDPEEDEDLGDDVELEEDPHEDEYFDLLADDEDEDDIDPADEVHRAKYVDDEETSIDETKMADPEIAIDREDDVERFTDR